VTIVLQDLTLKPSYESGVDDLVQDFYIPALRAAVSYDRIAGFFSSSSLAVAARGIAGLIGNSGIMRLLASPKINREDARILEASTEKTISFFEGKMLDELDDIKSAFEQDHLQALGWMLSNGYLEIKLAIVKDLANELILDRLFHQKIGVLKDKAGNQLSFSGSINESATGWINNIEEFKVFRAWLPGQREFFDSDSNRFEQLWEGKRSYVRVVDLPQAVKERLIEYGDSFSLERMVARIYMKSNKNNQVRERLALFSYQKEALQMWIDNDCRLLFEMATGTGKTRTALACVDYAMEKEDVLVVVIACPQTTLSRQWMEKEVGPAGFVFDMSIIADGTNSAQWRDQLSTALIKINVGYYRKIIIYTTHATASGNDFVDIISQFKQSIPFCFVGDEAHVLGAPKTKRALLNRYCYRIGLSATPSRWFDESGTLTLFEYFGGKVFEFPIEKALSTINPLTNRPFLVNYYYKPLFIALTEDELESYKKLTTRIKKLSLIAKNSDEYQKSFESLLFARAAIQKNAENKFPALLDLLRSKLKIDNTLLFVSEKQIDPVMDLLKSERIVAHRYTEKQGTAPSPQYNGISERQYLINKFKAKAFQMLVAISCLDEGIDIPSADTAILMANSTNPREYIQRIGRVIRQSLNKGNAYIYDFIIEPSNAGDMPIELMRFEKSIFERELIRAHEMARNAINNAEIQTILDKKLWEVLNNGDE
jgi:superfamily II DNA or RNA helicase